ncbi:hypothetical protein HPDFL43_17945 [Hoeflea phototrophica DFL-43]|uniref:Uncharacterized protein n=1 Tax=Hoeflea phototrophica (strain DSM 17068 / NCIMB 14078 / DFL-43) TaxID=411684 RepID=A9DG61_HOEPD|nr:hypothetical protein HPDFL43_17945 [Hoeflea phototrophica DFL-43]
MYPAHITDLRVPLKLTARNFTAWFFAFAALLALGKVFFAQALWFVVPLLAGRGCVSGGICGEVAQVLGLWLQPSLLLAAAWVGAVAFYRRGLAVGSRFWVLFPLALLLPDLPSFFMYGSFWGIDLSAAFLFFPRAGLVELLPLLAFGALLCFHVEYMPGFAGSILRTRLYGSIPIGLIYVGSCLWIGSDLALSLSPALGIPVFSAQSIHDALHFPISVFDGEVFAGLPPNGDRPDLLVPLGSLINLISFAILVFALVLDGSGRLRRPEASTLGMLNN